MQGTSFEQLALFRYLMPSMLSTVDEGFQYRMYIAYDLGDALFDNPEVVSKAKDWLNEHVHNPLASRGISFKTVFLRFDNPLRKPGPVFNFMMKAAADDGAEYLYRINDDTEFTTLWAKTAVNTLQNFNPKNLGAVGPICLEGNTEIMTHDMVHRQHLDVFPTYYPSILSDWWMDDWISRVYGVSRTKKGPFQVKHHTGHQGTRYEVDMRHAGSLEGELTQGAQRIQAWKVKNCDTHTNQCVVKSAGTKLAEGAMITPAPAPIESKAGLAEAEAELAALYGGGLRPPASSAVLTSLPPPPAAVAAQPALATSALSTDPPNTAMEKRVIAYSFYGGKNPRYTDGAIANVQLAKSFFPGWTVRMYYDQTAPKDILKQLEAGGAELVDMSGSVLSKNQMLWRFAAASDASVGRFCCRDVDSRLSAREKAAVDEWVTSGKRFHVLRDHPSHSNYPMSGGMWCGTHDAIPDMEDRLKALNKDNGVYMADMNFLNDIVWPIAQTSLVQHDSFSCTNFGGGYSFPTPRVGGEHVGSVYLNGVVRQVDVNLLLQKLDPHSVCADRSASQPMILHTAEGACRSCACAPRPGFAGQTYCNRQDGVGSWSSLPCCTSCQEVPGGDYGGFCVADHAAETQV